jgi:hypothetical protein
MMILLAQTSLPINPADFITDPPIALLIIILLAAIIGAYRGWWVPKFIYDEAVKRADAASKANEAMSTALKELTQEIRQRGL